MNVLRAALLVSGVTINVAWLVGICVRGTVGAPDLNPQLSMGPLPASPAPLPPLLIPARDPFMADVLAGTGEQSQSARSVLAGKADVAAVTVPDVASFAAGVDNFGVVATIVGNDESYALVEDGASVHVVHNGDSFAGSTVVEIAVDRVRLANGTRIAMVRHGTSAAQAIVASAAPSAGPRNSPSATPASAAPIPDRANFTALQTTSGVQPLTGTVAQPHPVIGQPALVQPNGNPAPVGGTSVFPSLLPTPSIVPLGGTVPGGHP